jgi:virginiamycin B lyase
MTMHMIIPGPHRAPRDGKHRRFVSPSTNGVLIQAYRHGAPYVPANLIAQALVDVSSGSKACGGQTGFPRNCTATFGAPPTRATGDDFLVSSYDAAPLGGRFPSAHLLGYGTLLNQQIKSGQDNTFIVYLGGVITGLTGNASFASLPGDGNGHTLGIAIDPVDFGNNPVTGYTNDPFANPIVASVTEAGGSGHAKLSLNGGVGVSQVTVSHSSDSVQLQYDGGGSIGYALTVTLNAPQVQGAGGATELIHVGPLLLGGSNNDYAPGKLALRGNGDEVLMSVAEAGAPIGTTYALSDSNCNAIADTVALSQQSASLARFTVVARGVVSTPPPGDGCTIGVSDGTSTVHVSVSNAYTGILGTPGVYELSVPTVNAQPARIALGPDGEMWFTERNAYRLAKISVVTKTISEYTMPAYPATPVPEGVASGPDGNVWWADCISSVGKMTTAGIPSAYELPNVSVKAIVQGPDGMMWFTEGYSNAIGRITTDGTQSSFTSGLFSFAVPFDITLGADGNLWFTEYCGDRIGKITSGGTITEFDLPISFELPWGITAGPDGALWFTEFANNRIGRIPTNATSGSQITEYKIPSIPAEPKNITVGPDGAIWFTECIQGKIGRLDLAKASPGTSNGMTEYSIPSGSSSAPWGISAGPDGAIWFSENGTNKIGRVVIQTTSLRRYVPRHK